MSLASTAAPPKLVRLQGTIESLGGAPVVDGPYTLRAEIFAVARGGEPLYSQEVATQVSGGAYALVLSPASASAGGLAEGPRFLQVTVVSGLEGAIGETLLPRQELASVPFAMMAGRVPETDTFRGALLARSSNQSIAHSTWTSVAWQTEIYDLGDRSGISEGSRAPERLVVPAGFGIEAVE